MRKLFTIFVLTLVCLSAFSQMPGGFGGGRPAGAGSQSMNVGHFYGKIVDNKTNKGLESVTVLLTGNKFDTATKKMKEAVFGTLITKANGDFSFENLSVMGNFKLKISSLGFKAQEKAINFGIKSEMPTSKRSGRPCGCPFNTSCSSRPRPKISSA